jgi:hypothetical protein
MTVVLFFSNGYVFFSVMQDRACLYCCAVLYCVRKQMCMPFVEDDEGIEEHKDA